MLPKKRVVAVMKDNAVIFKGSIHAVSEYLERSSSYIGKRLRHKGYITTKSGTYKLFYTGEYVREEPQLKLPPISNTQAIHNIAKLAKDAGLSYGEYVARMEKDNGTTVE